jgi:ABC-type Fe3+ transport system substrate-binding protein
MHSPIVYPAAAIKTSKNEAAAGAFLEYLKTDEVSSYLESLGFSNTLNLRQQEFIQHCHAFTAYKLWAKNWFSPRLAITKICSIA